MSKWIKKKKEKGNKVVTGGGHGFRQRNSKEGMRVKMQPSLKVSYKYSPHDDHVIICTAAILAITFHISCSNDTLVVV